MTCFHHHSPLAPLSRSEPNPRHLARFRLKRSESARLATVALSIMLQGCLLVLRVYVFNLLK